MSIAGKIQQDRVKDAASLRSPSSGYAEWGLAIAQVEAIDYKAMQVSLRILSGDETSSPYPVPLTFSSAGRRHMSGNMPCKGDICVVGWMVQESSGYSRTPIILQWLPGSVDLGYAWAITQSFGKGEGMDTPLERNFLDGISHRIRHKAKHLRPGDYVASSSSGADVLLDESVILSNRRGNEMMLRDADQSFLTRSISRHHAESGVRTYSGPVRREARILPSSMVSDGILWDTLMLISPETGLPITQEELASRSGRPEYGAFSDDQSTWDIGYLNPAYLFQRNPGEESFFAQDGGSYSPSLDPFNFLYWGSLITRAGYAVSDTSSDAVYGGKSLRSVQVITQGGVVVGVQNAYLEDDTTLSEHRVEVYNSDLQLPVNEILDGFDSDRISSPGTFTTPYVRVVAGTVVGNDPFDPKGLPLYGIPLSVNEEGTAVISALGRREDEMLSYLVESGDRFFALSRKGRFSMRGSNIGLSAEDTVSLSGSRLVLDFTNGVQFRSQSGNGYGVDISTASSAVKIYGGGQSTEGSSTRPDSGANPSLWLEGSNVTMLKGGRSVSIEAPTVNVRNSSRIALEALSNIQMDAGDSISSTTKVRNSVTLGKSIEMFSGPKDSIPTNGPVRMIQIVANPATGFVGGANDTYFNLYGDREEEFLLGNHTTQVRVGNMTYATDLGTWTARAVSNQTSLSPAGKTTTIAVGNSTENVTAGAYTVSATVAATMKTTGQAVVSGTTSTYLGGPGKVGPIVSGADLDPLTGIPLLALGLGSPGHLIGPSI